MADLNSTPSAGRIRIAFFGLRNAGKSTLVNAFTGQDVAIVSDTPGTTTDPVSKAMEILPLGPCLVTDTAGLDDVGELGELRVQKTLRVLETTDIAVWVRSDAEEDWANLHDMFLGECRRRAVVVVEYRRGDSVDELKRKIAAIKLADAAPGLLDGIIEKGDRVICVCPIDESAPKGRLILPQVQLIRDCLDRHATALVCQPEELGEMVECANNRIIEYSNSRMIECSNNRIIECSNSRMGKTLVVTDSQAFGKVKSTLNHLTVQPPLLTSFSILFARQKGDLAEFLRGVEAVKGLKDGDTVLVAEGCTHHRQCNDIGTVKIPKALSKLTGGLKLNFVFSSGNTFPLENSKIRKFENSTISLVVHCGGCMLTRREVLRRVACAKEAGVPIVNYGVLLAAASGMTDVSEDGIVRA